ncbi:MAG: hypothetical protein KJ573_08145 [Proteobacteria bacterium]|jgi:hypothetical protein|nr:hypothetical protein [Desulfobacterales bacterium]MBL6967827.1 hypothetical protein [Desulfobacteraceae bacterium]MBU0734372.1 hypothetical protein [Pseudomonadota bacterium]MBL7102033.1 hypothetical protein [Desulfobacteraceae bacterium]MBU0989071.1 hypothetical protein [Pseudomonadota bacterium]
MHHQIDIEGMNSKIVAMKKIAGDLIQTADEFPAIARNTARILSSLKMLEINLSDLVDFESQE